MNILSITPPTNALELRFQQFGTEFSLDVEFIAVVDYEGERDIEYAAILDGQMLLFHVDGQEVSIHKKMIPIAQFRTVIDRKRQAREGYGL